MKIAKDLLVSKLVRRQKFRRLQAVHPRRSHPPPPRKLKRRIPPIHLRVSSTTPQMVRLQMEMPSSKPRRKSPCRKPSPKCSSWHQTNWLTQPTTPHRKDRPNIHAQKTTCRLRALLIFLGIRLSSPKGTRRNKVRGLHNILYDASS